MRRRRWVIIGVIGLALGAALLLLATPTTDERTAPTPAATPEAPRAVPVIPAPSPPTPVITATAQGLPLARFEGEVIDPDGAPIAGAELVFEHDGAERLLRSDANGRFALDAEDGAWSLQHVTAAGFLGYADSTSYRAARGARIDGLRIELQRARHIRGRVSTSTGKPVAGAKISAFEELGASWAIGGPLFDRSKENGEFEGEVSTERPELLRLSVSHACCIHQTVRVPVGDADVALNIVLAEAAGARLEFSGLVVTPQDIPVPEAWVSVRGSALLDAGVVYEDELVQTDEHGKFTLRVRSKVLRVWAEGAPGTSEVLDFPVSASPRLVLHPSDSSAISGRVTDQAGRPITRFTVWLTGGLNPERRDFVTADGTYSTNNLAPGQHKVRVETDDFAQSSTIEVHLRQGEMTGGVDFVLQRGRNISGAVIDENSGRPLAGAEVRGASRWTTTGVDGRFELKALPARVIELEASMDGYATRQLRLDEASSGEFRVMMRKVERPDGGWERDYEGIGVMLDFETVLDGGNGLPVLQLHPEGGARLAGVQLGDEVLAADGVAPFGLSPTEFNLHVKGTEGTVVRLTIRRDGRVFDLNVARRRLTW